MKSYDVVVIGGGPAGLASALAAERHGAETLIIERENALGGILKQCIHDGFGLVRFKEKLSGPEYAERFIEELKGKKIDVKLLSFVTEIRKDGKFYLSVVSREGIEEIEAKAVVLATGCRERTAKQVSIHGTRPAGVFTAGTAQRYVNIEGFMPTKRCVILGSGDIGLIMARRITLEGGTVLGVYEAKSTPSGLTRNIHQCLYDYDIPLHLSSTVTRVFGEGRLEGVEIAKVDEKMRPLPGTEERIDCDALILSVGLIPENELAEKLSVSSDPRSKGATCDGQMMTDVGGVFTCGNATHVNDLVDYVSESGEIAGKNAALYDGKNAKYAFVRPDDNLLYVVPQRLNLSADNSETVIYFRSKEVRGKSVVTVKADGKTVLQKKYPFLRPPEMERLKADFSSFPLKENSVVEITVEEGR